MELIELKLFLILLIFLFNINLSQQNGIETNEKMINETCAALAKNIISLYQNTEDLEKLLSDEKLILDALQRTLHPDTVSSPIIDCPTVDIKLSELNNAIRKKIDDNGEKHSQKLEEFSDNLNCFDIKTQKLIATTALYEQQMNKLEKLAERFDNLKQKVENYKPVAPSANEQITQIIIEVNGKLDAQELKLRELESQIPLIEKASEYLELRKKKNRKCKKCLQIDVANLLFSMKDE